jgi:hypothetical protein
MGFFHFIVEFHFFKVKKSVQCNIKQSWSNCSLFFSTETSFQLVETLIKILSTQLKMHLNFLVTLPEISVSAFYTSNDMNEPSLR